MKRLSLITQFKIEFLLPFTGCRKGIGKMPDCIGYFPHKNLLATGQHPTGLAKILVIFLCKGVCGLWANIAQVIFLCNIGSGKLRQHCIQLFPEKRLLCGLSQHCITINFLVQCCLRRIWALLSIQYPYTMLSQFDRYNTVYVILLRKVVC